jgi:hypothetical protein
MCPAPRARFSLRVYSKGADEKLTDSTSDLRQTDGTAEFAQALGETTTFKSKNEEWLSSLPFLPNVRATDADRDKVASDETQLRLIFAVGV